MEEILLGCRLLLDPGTEIKLIGARYVFIIETFMQAIVGGERFVFDMRLDVLTQPVHPPQSFMVTFVIYKLIDTQVLSRT